jgi:hypothetical protein
LSRAGEAATAQKEARAATARRLPLFTREARMREEMNETLRSKERTVEGRHLHEPDGFPHSMMGMLVFLIVVFPLVVFAFYVSSGVSGALVTATILVFIVFPITISKMKRGIDESRHLDELEEAEVERAEAAGLPRPRNSFEVINDALSKNYEERNPGHRHY